MSGTTILLLTWLGIRLDMHPWYFFVLGLQAVAVIVEFVLKLIGR